MEDVLKQLDGLYADREMSWKNGNSCSNKEFMFTYDGWRYNKFTVWSDSIEWLFERIEKILQSNK